MNQTTLVLLSLLALAAPVASHAGGVSGDPSPERGKTLWLQEVTVEDESRSCSTCHGSDLSKTGQHQRTKKAIEPMAKSVNPERYEDPKKVAKWFKRNCKWTWGRECTPQEQADILAYLKSL